MSIENDEVGSISDALRGFYEAGLGKPGEEVSVIELARMIGEGSDAGAPATENIERLSAALRTADTIRSTWPSIWPDAASGLFIAVEDAYVRRFLRDILMVRVSHNDGRELNGAAPKEEQEAMLTEMGFSPDDIKGATLEQVVEKALRGELKLTSQTL